MIFNFLDDCVCPRGNSYIRVDLTQRKLIRHTDDIRFEFKTTQSSSLLLHAMGKHRDFLRVKLVQGQLKFSVDLGTGINFWTIQTDLENSLARAHRSQEMQSLKLLFLYQNHDSNSSLTQTCHNYLVGFLPGKGTITVPTGALNDNKWHFVEITRNGRRVKVNVDRRVAGRKYIGVTSPQVKT